MLYARTSGSTQHAPPQRQSRAVDDAQLIAHILTRHTGSKNDFGRLMARHRAWIFQRCLRHLGNHHDAEDCTQEVVLRVYGGMARFEGRASFRSWLHSIVDNQCRTFATRRAKHVTTDHIEHLIELREELQGSRPEDSSGERLQVQSILANLPAHAREILHLRFFHDRSLEEIASLLDISLSAAKMRLYRALDQFKDRYMVSETSSGAATTGVSSRTG